MTTPSQTITPRIRAVWDRHPDDPSRKCWLWRLLEPWAFILITEDDRFVERRLEQGFLWDGASKPFPNQAILATPSSHWSMVVPSLEHDDMCRNWRWWQELGVSSQDAAWHFYQRCIQFGTGAECLQWKAVSWFGPKWSAKDANDV